MFRHALALLLTLTSLASAQTPDVLPSSKMFLGKGMIGHDDSECKLAKTAREIYSNEDTIQRFKTRCEESKKKFQFLALECIGTDNNQQLTCTKVQPILMNLDTGEMIQRGKVFTIADHDGQPTQKEIKSFLRHLNRDFKKYRSNHQTDAQFAMEKILTVFVAGVCTAGMTFVVTATGGLMGAPVVLGTLGVAGGSFVLANGLFNFNSGYRSHPEQIDTTSYNWSIDQRKVRTKQFNLFADFMLQ